MDIKLDAYGKSYNQHITNLVKMLDPYVKDILEFEKWHEKFMEADKSVDDIVYNAFHLDQQSIDHIQRESRPAEWTNY